jgi:DNA primase
MIDWTIFRNWAEDNFENVTVSGDEIKVNSIFTDDRGQHLWCNPSKNAYHCWKSDNSGNLFDLVSQVSGCTYPEAINLLSDDNELRALEDRINQFYNEKEEKEVVIPNLSLPPDTFEIKNLIDKYRQPATNYMKSRDLPIDGLFFCINGKYKNRIIIPYYDAAGTLIYWNARDIFGNSKAKYMGPDNKVGVGKGDVIYMSSWPKAGSKIYLAEGEFDAMALSKCGLHGAACGGKVLGDKQLELIRQYRICICFDADKSGMDALNKIGDKLISSGIKEVTYVQPPVTFKDWNNMLVNCKEKVLNAYVSCHEKPFTAWTSTTLRFNI